MATDYALGLILEDRNGGQCWLTLRRLDDMVRVINVLIQEGVTLRFREAPRWLDWGRYYRFWSVVRTVGLYELGALILVFSIIGIVKMMPPGTKREQSESAAKSDVMPERGAKAADTKQEDSVHFYLNFETGGRLIGEGSGVEIDAGNVEAWVARCKRQTGARRVRVWIVYAGLSRELTLELTFSAR